MLNRSSLKLWDIAYAPDCNSNLISLSQLCNSNITYIDNFKVMKLMQAGYPIAYAKCNQNLFILELATPNKAMQITKYGWSIHWVSKNRKIWVWHYIFGYISNARIIKTFKILTSMSNFNKAYNSTKIYNNFKQFNNNNSSNNKDLIPAAKVLLLTLSPDNNFDSLYILWIASK